MTQGTVKWFNAEKGYGFIVVDDSSDEIFVHHSAIQMEGYRSLAEGGRVQFEIAQGEKGAQAENVEPLD
ncbi:cold-shock protein [Brevibacterium ravenspurgense]|uniref:cold-shock protein n=1 Tax=Brevibacterium ravenspurgense TaxID=479117 RepID=UPI000783E3C8|nr:cold shock domain-containing protein [Brevibacterium ravenspurgense]